MSEDILTSRPDAEDVLSDLAWWLSGGMTLLVWTGIAMLLTA